MLSYTCCTSSQRILLDQIRVWGSLDELLGLCLKLDQLPSEKLTRYHCIGDTNLAFHPGIPRHVSYELEPPQRLKLVRDRHEQKWYNSNFYECDRYRTTRLAVHPGIFKALTYTIIIRAPAKSSTNQYIPPEPGQGGDRLQKI